jgi:two-component sensor histidine kinase
MGELGANSPRARSFRIGTMLMLFVILIGLPAWGFSSYIAARYALAERAAIEATGRGYARIIATSIDFRLDSLRASISGLALSRALLGGDRSAFYEEAKTISTAQGVEVALIAVDGVQILNTGRPYGAALPAAPAFLNAVDVAASQAPHHSRVFRSMSGDRWLMALSVPVMAPGEPTYILAAMFDSVQQLGDMIDRVEMPAGWIASVIDDASAIAARRPRTFSLIGQNAHPSVLSVLTPQRSGFGFGASAEGHPVYVFYHRLKDAPWTVLIGVPSAEVNDAVRDELAPVIGAGLAILLTSIALAWLLGRNFTETLSSIAQAAHAFRARRPGHVGVKASQIWELRELSQSLASAEAERNENEAQLKSLLADKDLLMQEVHHRVKNSLQLVRGILTMQARSSSHAEAKAALQAAASRILTVADVHQHLYQGHSTADVEIHQYLSDLARDLTKSMLDHSPGHSVQVECPRMIWPSEKVIALGLMVTELITNAIKYGAGDVRVSVTGTEDEGFVVVVEDQGPGFPADVGLGHGGGLGSRLIASLVRPEDGSVVVDRNAARGRVVVTLGPQWRAAKA